MDTRTTRRPGPLGAVLARDGDGQKAHFVMHTDSMVCLCGAAKECFRLEERFH